MSKRWLVVPVVVLSLTTAGVAGVALADRADGVAGRAVAAATTAPVPPPTSETPAAQPVPTAQEATPTQEPAPAQEPAPVAAAAGAPLAGKIKPGVVRTAPATFYDSDGGGACLYDPGPDPLTVAMNWSDYEDSKACGAYILVRANGKSLTVRVTNLCPAPCRVGQLDLSKEAFARLADPVRGEIPVTWTLVSPPELTKKISIRYKAGSSQHWCGIQAIDHRNPVARLEVQAGGQWKELRRTDYNHFLSESGAGCGGAIAVTDIYGERLVVNPLPVKPGVVQATNVQFAVR